VEEADEDARIRRALEALMRPAEKPKADEAETPFVAAEGWADNIIATPSADLLRSLEAAVEAERARRAAAEERRRRAEVVSDRRVADDLDRRLREWKGGLPRWR